MIDALEIQKLRDLPIEGVAERLGIEVVRHKALCPFHDDHHASLSFSVRRNTFRCFACGEHGGVIDLVMKYTGKGFREAAEWLGASPQPSPKGKGDGFREAPVIGREATLARQEHQLERKFRSAPEHQLERKNANVNETSLPCPLPQRKREPPKTSPLGGGQVGVSLYARYFEHPWLSDEARRFLFEERRLDPRVVSWCRLTSWRDRRGVPWLQIPYFDREGRLIGVQNRNLVKGGQPRFRFPTGSECSIYNLPVLNRLKPGDELWITEGCSDCWAMLSSGRKAIAIPSATLLKREQLLALTKRPAGYETSLRDYENENFSIFNIQSSISLHMYPDRDEPGERLFMQLKELLPSLQHHQLPPSCKDYGEYYVKYCRS